MPNPGTVAIKKQSEGDRRYPKVIELHKSIFHLNCCRARAFQPVYFIWQLWKGRV